MAVLAKPAAHHDEHIRFDEPLPTLESLGLDLLETTP